MPLNWNAEKVPQQIREENWQLMEKAIWNSMVIGVPELTEKTIEEAVLRTKLFETQKGAYLYTHEDKPYWLWEHLPLFIGLWTNVSKKSRAKFMKVLEN